jgi:CDP-diglyceride synthetase
MKIPSKISRQIFYESYDKEMINARFETQLSCITKNKNNFYSASQNSENVIVMKRCATGLTLGVLSTAWVFSKTIYFFLWFLPAALTANYEYNKMIQKKTILSAKGVSIFTLLLSCTTAAFYPIAHDKIMPFMALLLMSWTFLFNKKIPSVNEISTSLLGMFFIGYLPSFWIRLKSVPKIDCISTSFIDNSYPTILSVGSFLTWGTWVAIVLADSGAYFVGKKYGKTSLAIISSAAGSASPNKTIEGLAGGLVLSTLFSIYGAILMKWPAPIIMGGLYGILMSLISLVGDLTISLIKRDVGTKDTGSILPGHGGLLDRIDSYIFTAPISFYFCTSFLPLVSELMRLKK